MKTRKKVKVSCVEKGEDDIGKIILELEDFAQTTDRERDISRTNKASNVEPSRKKGGENGDRQGGGGGPEKYRGVTSDLGLRVELLKGAGTGYLTEDGRIPRFQR